MITVGDTLILGIETSCDDTAAAVVKNGHEVLSDILHTQEVVHAPYGGVVPEFASRVHIEVVDRVVREAIAQADTRVDQLHAVAVTQGPGLIGALLVGLSFGKALAYSCDIPLLGVHHLEGHLASARLGITQIPFPHIALLVSGGHSNLYAVQSPEHYEQLGRTLDDAAGEAFDKGAKMLGLGYPGGPLIDQLAQSGDARKAPFPLPYPSTQSFDFSFSGIKTALRYFLQTPQKHHPDTTSADIAAGYQASIVQVLVQKTIHAAVCYDISDIVVVGGVAANSLLRKTMADRAATHQFRVHVPELRHCTDNGAMIAAAGWNAYTHREFASLDIEPFAQQPLRDRPETMISCGTVNELPTCVLTT
ncbi:MAG TPA: tRNA (adenosine(37)-N6)-threonylcarbamoyltransferase complex transferase subunit TsaD [Nitrospirales bacterium]|nr:tRNA (adenosine(37)-N6)-threonylcarbamoyltransferase complex transferase subunit TsaD [Nitrospirales bacterium]HIB53534.1 tRNA (adenosine(37)-N6)-threonylcarbamoyltransferase complex transferase subunit TsaD [Nitrospirales bacterium]HIO22077.1 tRNA (adenosine(37)-N6)-threonylcarbamoyltransferase complex transferase subunit TsaD [Nitrospirales bacterium]HIO69566.1 tRNA (adenosine(37)-N6)-threonylcarbamoyltransferase complex transferase subunit TsaD [Nitrospirales bacterium]